MDRRDFLRPRTLAQTAGHLVGAVEAVRAAVKEAAPDTGEVALLRVARGAMATTFEVLLPFGTPAGLEAAAAALDEIDQLEGQLTVYRDTSEVSGLNRMAPYGPVRVEGGLFRLLELAAEIHRETGGAQDVTAGVLVKAWGFFRRQGRVPSDPERAEALIKVGMEHVALDREKQTVRYLRPGVEINLGSIGKGYALDRAAAVLRTGWNLTDALLHGGHSSVYAMGTEPGGPRGWAVGITHPWDEGRRLAVVRLRDRGLGTSAATFQHLEHAGRKLGHLLDPRTGWPAEGTASATAVAPTAAEADALATAFFVLGVDGTRAYCERHPEVGAVLLADGSDTPVVFNLAADAVELPPPAE